MADEVTKPQTFEDGLRDLLIEALTKRTIEEAAAHAALLRALVNEVRAAHAREVEEAREEGRREAWGEAADIIKGHRYCANKQQGCERTWAEEFERRAAGRDGK